MNHLRLFIARLLSYRLLSTKKLHVVWEYKHLAKLLKHFHVDCVFDVGANYGQYARMLRTKAKYRGLIISFEPIPDAAARLRALARNDPLWVIEECALSTDDGEKVFHVMQDSQFSSLNEPSSVDVKLFEGMNKIRRDIRVRTETLESALSRLRKKYDIHQPFLKMDTQGHDVSIVKSSPMALKQFMGLQSELSVKKIYENSCGFMEAISTYQELGFSLSAFIPNNVGHFPLLVETDCIMVRSDLVTDSDLMFNN